MLVQISFAKDADLTKVRAQLEELAKNEDIKTFTSCFLNRAQVTEAGFDTNIIDMIDETLGDRHEYATNAIVGFANIFKYIDDLRTTVGNMVEKLYILDAGTAEGVAKEIEIFTRGKLVMMY